MADWLHEFDASYRFMRVSRATGAEVSELEGFETGGSISRNLDTDVYESASATREGGLDVGADLVRVYLDADFGGEVERVALGTFVPSVPKRDVSGEVDRVSVNLFFTSFAKQARRSRKGGFTGCANVFSPIPVTA